MAGGWHLPKRAGTYRRGPHSRNVRGRLISLLETRLCVWRQLFSGNGPYGWRAWDETHGPRTEIHPPELVHRRADRPLGRLCRLLSSVFYSDVFWGRPLLLHDRCATGDRVRRCRRTPDRSDFSRAKQALMVALQNPLHSEAIRIACLKALLTPPNMGTDRKECWQALARLGPEAAFLMPSLAELL